MSSCPACLEPKESWTGTVQSPCGHEMCQQCFITHIRLNPKATCPECRAAFTKRPMQEQSQSQSQEQRQQLDRMWASLGATLQVRINKKTGAIPMEECD